MMGGKVALMVLLSVLLVADNVGRSTAANVFTATVFGEGVCTDCTEGISQDSHPFKAFQVAIVCETSTGKHEVKAFSLFDSSGKFAAVLPSDVLDSTGDLKRPCYAELFDPAKRIPCPTKGDFKLVLHSSSSPYQRFSTPSSKVTFSRTACVSAFLQFPQPKFPPLTKKPLFKLPPLVKKPLPQLPPLVKKPLPLPQLPPLTKKPCPLPHLPPLNKKPFPQKKPVHPFPPKN